MGGNIPGGNFPGADFLRGEFDGWEFSQGGRGIFQEPFFNIFIVQKWINSCI